MAPVIVLKNKEPSTGALDLHTASKTLEIKSFSCTRGQKDPSERGAFVPNEDENANYKKSLFLH